MQCEIEKTKTHHAYQKSQENPSHMKITATKTLQYQKSRKNNVASTYQKSTEQTSTRS